MAQRLRIVKITVCACGKVVSEEDLASRRGAEGLARRELIPSGDLAPDDEDGPAAAVEPVVVESPVVELMVLELGVVAAEEPPMVTKDMGLVVPELRELLLLEAMGERHVLLGVDESGCGRRTWCRE